MLILVTFLFVYIQFCVYYHVEYRMHKCFVLTFFLNVTVLFRTKFVNCSLNIPRRCSCNEYFLLRLKCLLYGHCCFIPCMYVCVVFFNVSVDVLMLRYSQVCCCTCIYLCFSSSSSSSLYSFSHSCLPVVLLLLSATTLCPQKNDTDITHYRFNPHQPILVIFGRDVAERVCY